MNLRKLVFCRLLGRHHLGPIRQQVGGLVAQCTGCGKGYRYVSAKRIKGKAPRGALPKYGKTVR